MTSNRDYYNAFAEGYDARRNAGYHKLIDDQAAEIVRRYGEGKELLEVGCGTGLILQRTARFAARAQGVDLSPGMLEHARRRGLDVREGEAGKLPFPDASFDVAYSFKVLAHVPEFEQALLEMQRVVRPGGHLIFDVYNRRSLRYLTKHLFGPRKTSQRYDEHAIPTRFLTREEAIACFPAGTQLAAEAGIRTALPAPFILRIPLLKQILESFEWGLMDSRASRYAGFLVFVLQKDPLT